MQGENRVWQNAIVQKFATSCDYADWLGPYLRPSAFEDPSYADFWLKDLSLSEATSFGLDTSYVSVEKLALIVAPIRNLKLKRVFKAGEGY